MKNLSFLPNVRKRGIFFYRELNKFRNNKTDENRMVLNKTTSYYKLCIRKNKKYITIGHKPEISNNQD